MAKKKITYAEAIAEVEQILNEIRSGAMDVDKLSDAVRRANLLIGECRRILTKTEAEVGVSVLFEVKVIKILNRHTASVVLKKGFLLGRQSADFRVVFG
jgi:exodeoxyribonuclease VII small subunit